MKGKDFFNSKWMKKGATLEGQKKIKDNFEHWSGRVKNSGLLTRAKQLYQFFLSSEITGMQKVLVSAALLYIITPVDIICDFIPVLGWMDDVGVASFALSYIFSQMDKLAQLEEEQRENFLEKEIDGTSIKTLNILHDNVNKSNCEADEEDEVSSFFSDKK